MPDPNDIVFRLKDSAKIWGEFLAHLNETYPDVREEWKKVKSGPALTPVFQKKRICWLIPGDGYFVAGFVLGEKAVRAALESRLSEGVKCLIEEARPYIEGRGIRVEVRDSTVLPDLKLLTEIKTTVR